jgi:Carboxypeptidase regulatory-like domain
MSTKMPRLAKLVLLFAAVAFAAAPLSYAQAFQVASGKDKDQLRTLNGNVRNKGEQILPGAVVYLKNTKTLTVKSYIADDKGEFHFHALSPNVDYGVYAEYNGTRSQTKTLSSFDSRPVVGMDLRIDVSK